MDPEKPRRSLVAEVDAPPPRKLTPPPINFELHTPKVNPKLKFIARSRRMRKAAAHIRAGPPGLLALTCGTVCCSFILAIVFLCVLNVASIASIVVGALYLHECPAQPHIPVMLVAIGSIAVLICILDAFDRITDQRTKGETETESTDCEERRGRKQDQDQCIEGEVEDDDDWVTDSPPIKQPTGFTIFSSFFKTLEVCFFIYMCVIVYQIASTVSYTPDPQPHAIPLTGAAAHAHVPEVAGAEGVHLQLATQVYYCNPVVYLFAFWFTTATVILLCAASVFLACICFSATVFIALAEF